MGITHSPLYTPYDFFGSFPQGGLIVEVGVLYGNNADTMCNALLPDYMILIDSWNDCFDLKMGNKLDGDMVFNECKKRFANRFHVEFWRGRSEDEIPKLADRSVNFAYVDAWHTYEQCLGDMEALFPKMAPEGWLCGHDFCDIAEYGVVRAVAVFCDRHGLALGRLSDFPTFPRIPDPGRKNSPTQASYNSFGIQIPK